MKYSMARRITLLEQWTAIVRNFSDHFSVVFSILYINTYEISLTLARDQRYFCEINEMSSRMPTYKEPQILDKVCKDTRQKQIKYYDYFYFFFRFSIWKKYFQLSALPHFTLLRGPCNRSQMRERWFLIKRIFSCFFFSIVFRKVRDRVARAEPKSNDKKWGRKLCLIFSRPLPHRFLVRPRFSCSFFKNTTENTPKNACIKG